MSCYIVLHIIKRYRHENIMHAITSIPIGIRMPRGPAATSSTTPEVTPYAEARERRAAASAKRSLDVCSPSCFRSNLSPARPRHARGVWEPIEETVRGDTEGVRVAHLDMKLKT